ncbi:peptidase family C78-domain-containing protein [Russula vinacea]|nr:peptidase family C78-domain-containing protein [Russula vinacea]
MMASTNQSLFCMFCHVDLIKLKPNDRQTHYDDHLATLDTLRAHWLSTPTSGSHPRGLPSPAKSSPTRGISPLNSSANDHFWYHSLETEPPSNYTPGLIPFLRKILLTSVERNTTRRAVLCYERAVHIYREIWDAGWGCGYRNFMMLCAALMDQRVKPEYSFLLSNPIPPGVNNLKVWIEELGLVVNISSFDPEGAQKLKSKLVGYKKWIGTAELYVAFTYRGVPTRLADFDTPDGNVTPLLEWIKRYFDAHTQDHPTSVQERWRAATPVVISDRMPLILQHQGHSRTIIGYEIAKDGGTNLLAFDPSVRMTKIRDIVLSSLNLSKQRGSHLGDNKLSTARRLTESLKKPFQPRSERAGPSAEGRGESPPKRRRTGPIEDDVISVSQRNNSGHGAMTEIEAGKVGRDERTLDPRTVLKPFRVDQKILAKKNKYQVLWCPMEDPLTESDKQARREVISEHAC